MAWNFKSIIEKNVKLFLILKDQNKKEVKI